MRVKLNTQLLHMVAVHLLLGTSLMEVCITYTRENLIGRNDI